MGCDIHLFVEKRIVPNKWVSADKWTPDKYSEDKKTKSVDYKDSFYSDRNYSLFAILANVRNGFGFAGCDTGDGFNPISKPKGLPVSVCKEIKQESDSWDIDGHSHSWFTIQELLDYDWTQTTKLRGWISALEYIKWNIYKREEGEKPDSWCGGISGRQIRHITEEEMQRRIEEVKQKYNYDNDCKLIERLKETKELDNYYCPIEFEQPYYKCCRSFLSDTLPRLWKLGNPKDVRIVFWFDN